MLIVEIDGNGQNHGQIVIRVAETLANIPVVPPHHLNASNIRQIHGNDRDIVKPYSNISAASQKDEESVTKNSQQL